ncbi:MAG TPA: hypothetical protein VNV15_05025 [Opitutaceae bacterium]|jgi:hypothetical protein|nr:hypothetical protein [Opitutaceae bacterium]
MATHSYPPADILVAADTVGEKYGRQIVVKKAVEQLGNALNSNFDAQKFLKQKLDKTDKDLSEVKFTITKYGLAHPEDRGLDSTK